MLNIKSLNIDPVIFETYWIGDESFSKESSNIDLWIESGQGFSLSGNDGSLIKYRGLTSLEMRNVLPIMQSYGMNVAQEMVRYGLISIKGIHLQRESFGGIRGLSNDSLAIIDQLTFPLPVKKVINTFLSAYGVEPSEDDGVIEQVSLVTWLGGLIARESFRNKR